VLLFAAYLLIKPHFKVLVSRTFDGVASGLSGLLLGSCGIGGPPVALYLNATNHPFERIRALLSQFVSGISVFAIIAASLMGGGLEWLKYLLIAIPAYGFGMALASYLLKKRDISFEVIRSICLMLLIANSSFNLILLFVSAWI
jgi:uncharacterized membrane protein YfcA